VSGKGVPGETAPRETAPRETARGEIAPTLAADHDTGEPTPSETILERTCRTLCEIGIVVMAAIVILEIITRNLFNLSFMISDELGGYIIVGITFLSLPVCQVNRAYHHVLFVQTRLGPRTRAVSHLIFQLLSLGFCLLLIWQLTRLTLQSYRSGDVAPTVLATPLWIPQALMPLGCLALSITLLRAIRMSLHRIARGA
jgi:TRAP-type C4-dicarboxylate transport system permease small subunit